MWSAAEKQRDCLAKAVMVQRAKEQPGHNHVLVFRLLDTVLMVKGHSKGSVLHHSPGMRYSPPRSAVPHRARCPAATTPGCVGIGAALGNRETLM